jgi:hypothetical protein
MEDPEIMSLVLTVTVSFYLMPEHEALVPLIVQESMETIGLVHMTTLIPDQMLFISYAVRRH